MFVNDLFCLSVVHSGCKDIWLYISKWVNNKLIKEHAIKHSQGRCPPTRTTSSKIHVFTWISGSANCAATATAVRKHPLQSDEAIFNAGSLKHPSSQFEPKLPFPQYQLHSQLSSPSRPASIRDARTEPALTPSPAKRQQCQQLEVSQRDAHWTSNRSRFQGFFQIWQISRILIQVQPDGFVVVAFRAKSVDKHIDVAIEGEASAKFDESAEEITIGWDELSKNLDFCGESIDEDAGIEAGVFQ